MKGAPAPAGPRPEAGRFSPEMLNPAALWALPAQAQQPPASLGGAKGVMDVLKLSGAPALALSFEPDCVEYYDACRPSADAILLHGRREVVLDTGSGDRALCEAFARWAREAHAQESAQQARTLFSRAQQDKGGVRARGPGGGQGGERGGERGAAGLADGAGDPGEQPWDCEEDWDGDWAKNWMAEMEAGLKSPAEGSGGP